MIMRRGAYCGFTHLAILCALVLTGCVATPPVSDAQMSNREELAAHVKFLAQPALKGRKPGTRGSRLAREYILARFKAYGLVPWGPAHDYALSFGYGKNVVGVLPGCDPNHAGELVLVSAHYDHLGKEGGRVCPGAADNAAGVAALLATAKALSESSPRPARTIVFAAFDWEEQMLFGSFAFTCRDEVRRAKIVAVVNLDVLGRDFLDVVRNTVFVAGTEAYPAIREEVRQAGRRAGIRVLPIGSDLIGPVSDHVAFESRGIPCLFFTSGLYRDYHKPTDTADKLELPSLARAATVAAETVRALAAGHELPRRTVTDHGDFDELRTLKTVLAEVARNSERAGLKRADAAACRKMEQQADNLLKQGRYATPDRERLICEATGTLAPYLLPFDVGAKGAQAHPQKGMGLLLQILQIEYIKHRLELMEGYRQLVAQVLKYRPGLFRGMPKFEFKLYDIAEEDIRLTEDGHGKYALEVLEREFDLKAEGRSSLLGTKSFRGFFGFGFDVAYFKGDRTQLVDICLLKLAREQTNSAHTEKFGRVWHAVTGAAPRGDFRALLADRLTQGGFHDETAWLAACLESENPDVVGMALAVAKGKSSGRIQAAVAHVIRDHKLRFGVRAAAIELVTHPRDREGMLALCDVLSDQSVPGPHDEAPWSERPEVQIICALQKQIAPPPKPPKTIGEMAHAQLKRVTGRDYGADSSRWRAWLETLAQGR